VPALNHETSLTGDGPKPPSHPSNAIDSQSADTRQPATENARTTRFALLSMAATVLLVNYVESMVFPALPIIQRSLSTTESLTAWISSIFLIVGAGTSVLFGKLGDTYGRKRMYVVAMAVYCFGAGLASFSPTIFLLLVGRALQGVGFATLPLSLALVSRYLPKEKVASGQGLLAGVSAIGTVLGLVVGPEVVLYYGWHWAFRTAFLLSLGVALFLLVALESDRPTTQGRVDYIGVSLLMAGVSTLLALATEGATVGWTSSLGLELLSFGAGLLLLCVWYESRQRDPVIPLALLRIRNVLLANIAGILDGVAMFLIFFTVVYYSETPPPFGLGLGIVSVGLVMLPATALMIGVGPIVGRSTSRFGPRPTLMAGAVTLGLGFLLLLTERGSFLLVALDVAVALTGVTAIFVPVANMISHSLPREIAATGFGLNSMLKSLGYAVGPILASAIMVSNTVPIAQGIGSPETTVPSPTAFDFLFGVGIVLAGVILGLGGLIRNYYFPDGPSRISRSGTAESSTAYVRSAAGSNRAASEATNAPRIANLPRDTDPSLVVGLMPLSAEGTCGHPPGSLWRKSSFGSVTQLGIQTE
jgi:MFS family permease